MNKRTSFLLGATMFLIGVAVGFFAAPCKGGVRCGNNSGNTNYYYGATEPKDVEEESMYGDEEDIPF